MDVDEFEIKEGSRLSVIYYVGHYGYLWRFLVHKTIYHKHDRALFIMNNSGFKEETENFLNEQIEAFPIYGELCFFPDNIFKNLSSEGEVKEKICDFFDSMLKEKGCDLTHCSTYCGFDDYSSFPVYLTIRHKKFTMCGFDTQIISENRYKIRRPDPQHYWNVLRECRAQTWDNEYVSNVMWFTTDLEKERAIVSKPSMVVDCDEQIEKMPNSDKINILSFFKIPTKIRRPFNMVVCSSFWVMSVKYVSLKEFLTLYAQIADYFLGSEKIIIKPHPNGDPPDKEWLFFFSDSYIIRGYVPFQLLKHIPNFTPKKIISTSGTAMAGDGGSSVIDLTQGGVLGYKSYHKLFVIMSMIKELGNDISLEIELGVLMPVCEAYIQQRFPELLDTLTIPREKAKVVVKIMDETFGKMCDVSREIESNSIIFCLNSHGNHVSDLRDIRYAMPICIHKKAIKTGADVSEEMFVVYTKNEKIRRKISTYTQKYELKHSGIQIEISPPSSQLDFDQLLNLTACNFNNRPIVLAVTDESDIDCSQEVLAMLGINKYRTYDINSKGHIGSREYIIFSIGCDFDAASSLIRRQRLSCYSDFLYMDNHIASRLPNNNERGTLEYIIAMMHKKIENPNRDKVIKYLRRSVEKGNTIAKNELIDELTKRSSEDDLREAYDVCFAFAKEGNISAMGRLARMHRDGKYVEKNLDEAIIWMRAAGERNTNWAKNELADLLIKRALPGDHEEAYAICSSLAESGDAGAMGRLGRMYRDGKGIEKNAEEAIKWMQMATEKNVDWMKELKVLTQS